jgi:hypothetical protein
MPKHHANTYVAQQIDGDAVEAVIAACRAEAAGRLGGADGVVMTSAGTYELAGAHWIGTTWRRDWETPDPAPPELDP